MSLANFTVIHAQPDSFSVVVQAWDDREMVLTFIPREALEDHFRRSGVKGKAANLVVDRNLEAFSRIISAKYERGEHRPGAGVALQPDRRQLAHAGAGEIHLCHPPLPGSPGLEL